MSRAIYCRALSPRIRDHSHLPPAVFVCCPSFRQPAPLQSVSELKPVAEGRSQRGAQSTHTLPARHRHLVYVVCSFDHLITRGVLCPPSCFSSHYYTFLAATTHSRSPTDHVDGIHPRFQAVPIYPIPLGSLPSEATAGSYFGRTTETSGGDSTVHPRVFADLQLSRSDEFDGAKDN